MATITTNANSINVNVVLDGNTATATISNAFGLVYETSRAAYKGQKASDRAYMACCAGYAAERHGEQVFEGGKRFYRKGNIVAQFVKVMA